MPSQPNTRPAWLSVESGTLIVDVDKAYPQIAHSMRLPATLYGVEIVRRMAVRLAIEHAKSAGFALPCRIRLVGDRAKWSHAALGRPLDRAQRAQAQRNARHDWRRHRARRP